MRHFITDENFPLVPEYIEDQPTDRVHSGPTGPRSPEGKAISSLNSLKHGCRSEKTILPDEDPGEFEFTVDWWFEHYHPQDNVAVTLVQETARAQWFFKRNTRRLEGFEWELPTDPSSWTEENHKQFNNFTRYKTTTERAFFKCFKELEAYYGRLDRAEQLQERARAAVSKLQMEWCHRDYKAAAEELKTTQVVEVQVLDGKTVTSCYPTDQQIIKEAAQRPKPPIYLERFVLFPNGVPPEYSWANPNEIQKLSETIGVQKMTYDWWLELIKREQAKGTGHVGPILFLDPSIA
ncbi:MAG: hypothetical protein JO097_16415 [Acidobacteriaceae bacterium]|nr:hypothetical protein [Acidobacteriaceae bacterium]MBV9295661.1 hypothetical protein [Acidobacteriaceae bacterium]MBV9767746.1 hypothetical protein [Acidobacteriaceae bacterium]